MAHGRLLLLDSASLYFRAFFGVPDSLKAPDGTVVNALRGILDFTSTLTTQYRPEAIVACWDDDWRPQWRVDLIPSYKTQRLDTEGGEADTTGGLLGPQVPLIAEAFALLGIPVVGAADAEADDIIGTFASTWDGPVDIVTGDRDLFQLVDDARGVRVLYVARGVSKHDVVDNAWIRAKYGIDASQYVDFAVMRGDASDGLPGVAGIGDKTAAVLLKEFGDIEGILEARTTVGRRSSRAYASRCSTRSTTSPLRARWSRSSGTPVTSRCSRHPCRRTRSVRSARPGAWAVPPTEP
jgi:5'-3' exonuclease